MLLVAPLKNVDVTFGGLAAEAHFICMHGVQHSSS